MLSSTKTEAGNASSKNSAAEKDIPSKEEDPHAKGIQSPRVAVLVDTSSEWGRKLVQGVSSYAIKHGPWKLWVETHGTCSTSLTGDKRLNLPQNWKGDAIIASIENEAIEAQLSSFGCPVVNVYPDIGSQSRVPHVTSNVNAIAEMSVEHFNHRGVKNFGYVGPLKSPGVRQHALAFKTRVEQAGHQCHVFESAKDSNSANWGECRLQMANWLARLPKPIGIFTWQTNAAIQILDVCSVHGISVPDDVSILAGDDDTLLCGTTTPTISGVVTASEHIGFAAAKKIHEMLNATPGQVPAPSRELVDPIMVTLRQSTDSLAITDPDLLAAVRFIRINACRGITVQEVADSVPIGRRSLERKFKECFGRTPLDEIQRLRLARVRELLVKTDLAISKIAEDAGFGTPEYMTTMFKCRYGLTPLKFRSQSRAR